MSQLWQEPLLKNQVYDCREECGDGYKNQSGDSQDGSPPISWLVLPGLHHVKIFSPLTNLAHEVGSPPLESREPRNIVLSKFCSEIDRKFDVLLIACVSRTLDHILYL